MKLSWTGITLHARLVNPTATSRAATIHFLSYPKQSRHARLVEWWTPLVLNNPTFRLAWIPSCYTLTFSTPLADPKNPLVHRTSLAFFSQTRTKCAISCWTHYKTKFKERVITKFTKYVHTRTKFNACDAGQIPLARHTILSMALQHKVHLWSSDTVNYGAHHLSR